LTVIILMSGLVATETIAAPKLTIAEIQGSGDRSPFVGEIVKTTGVVTAKRKVSQDTFIYVQSVESDADDATSEGIVVIAPTANVAAGDLVDVEGRVLETTERQNNLTVTTISPAVVVKTGTGELPVPKALGASGAMLPTEAVFGPGGAILLLESMEGMLVSVADAKVVGPTNDFDEFWIVGNNGAEATGMNSLGGITTTPGDLNPERLQVQLDEPIPNPTDYQVKVGDTIALVVGVLDYSFGNYEIVATALDPVKVGSPPELPEIMTTEADLTIGSYNVENLDATVERQGLLYNRRDLDDDVAANRFETIGEQIVRNLKAPDIVALQEVQDDDGGEVSDTVTSTKTLQTLIDAITAAGGPTYKPIVIDPIDDAEGGQPGGNIRVAFLFNPARVTPEEAGIARIDDPSFAATRLPLVVPFTFGDQSVLVINVHLSSKGGSDPTYGTVQPPADSSLAARTQQARAIQAYLRATHPADSGPVIILGDFNTLYNEEPLQLLTHGVPTFDNLTLREGRAAERNRKVS
jgi:predicted extracellular nuclease